MEAITITTSIFWIAALVASLFFGLKAVTIFQVQAPKGKGPWAWWIHQFWLNFCGSFVGWVALWFVGRKVISCLGASCAFELTGWDVLISFLAFVGVTGFLPFTIVGLITGIKELVVKSTSFLK
jgi:hypothetical protein